MPLKHSVQEINLQNGAKGLIIQVPDNTVVSSTIHFRAGNDFAKRPEIHQVAHLMEHMAFGPNAEFKTMEEFSQAFSENGAISNASTFDTNMHYYADFANFEWQRILELQRLAVTEPRFPKELLETEKGNVHGELAGQADNTPRVLWQAIGRAIGGHSLKDNEKIKTINNVTIDDVSEHHQRTHTLANMRFVIAGDFGNDTSELIRQLESWQLPSGERLQPVIDKLHAAPAVAIRRQEIETVNIGIILAIPRILSSQELIIGAALNHLLTGTLHSRIFGKARSRGICYGVGSVISSDLGGASSWEFFGQVRPDNATELYKLIQVELGRLADGDISEIEMIALRKYLLGDHQLRGQHVSALASWYAADYFFDDSFELLDKNEEYIQHLTSDNLIALAKEFLGSGIWTSGEIGITDQAAAAVRHDILKPLLKG